MPFVFSGAENTAIEIFFATFIRKISRRPDPVGSVREITTCFMKKIAFIIIRYGVEVNGGAEVHCRMLAERLRPYYDVEVLTTTTRIFRDPPATTPKGSAPSTASRSAGSNPHPSTESTTGSTARKVQDGPPHPPATGQNGAAGRDLLAASRMDHEPRCRKTLLRVAGGTIRLRCWSSSNGTRMNTRLSFS